MDLIAELRTEIWYLLTQDEELKTLCGGSVRLYNTWADPNAKFPYLVHRMHERPLLDGAITELTYYLDIWDYDEKSMARLLDLRSRIVALLDMTVLTMPSGGSARFRYSSGGEVPEETAGIRHFATLWDVRVDRTADILAKLKE